MTLNFEELIAERVNNQVPPGMVFAKIEQADIEYFAYGTNSIHQVDSPDSDTIFEIGSITKLFTALLYARLEELNVLSLGDAIEDYLPQSLRAPKRESVSITFEHLLTHTSALPPMPPNFDHKDPMRSFAEYGADDLLAALETQTLEWAIGQSYVYSNFGYGLLGYISEVITGERWDQLIKKHICKPLGLDNTGTEAKDSPNNITTSHLGKEPVQPFSLGILAAGGSLTSSAKDMATLLAANLGLIDSELHSAMKKMQTASYRESPLYALGLSWHLQQRGKQEICWHRGETIGQTSFVALDAEVKKGIVMLSNSSHRGCCSDLAMAQIDPDTPLTEHMPHKVIEVTAPQLQKLAGKYYVDPAISFTVSAEQNHLTIAVTGQNGGKMYPVGVNQFETKDRRVFAIFSEDTLTIRQHGIDRIALKGT